MTATPLPPEARVLDRAHRRARRHRARLAGVGGDRRRTARRRRGLAGRWALRRGAGARGGRARTIVVRATSRRQPRRAALRGAVGMAAAARYLRTRGYAAALDLQGLIKSALFARASGARRVIGFATAQLREPQAAWAYRETVAGPPDGHVVQKNLAMLPLLGSGAGASEFPWRHDPSPVADAVAALPAITTAGGFAVLESGGRVAQQAMAGGALWRARCPPGADSGLPSVVTWGGAERPLAEAVVAGADGHAPVSPATSLATCSPRPACPPGRERRHRSVASGRLGRRAAGRPVRAHPPRAQWPVGSRRRLGVACRHLRVLPQAPVRARAGLRRRHRRRRSAGRLPPPACTRPDMSVVRLLARIRVALGGVMAALTVWLSQPTARSLTLGAGFVALGLRRCGSGPPATSRRAARSRPAARIATRAIRCTSAPPSSASASPSPPITSGSASAWCVSGGHARGGDPGRGGAPAREVRRRL